MFPLQGTFPQPEIAETSTNLNREDCLINRRTFVASAAASVTLPFTSAIAQESWPSREIHAICPFPPGNGADIVVRYYAKLLQDRVGKTVVVENKPGAFGNIATEAVARSKPDGHTISIMSGSSQLAAAASLFKKLPFDPVNDFEKITTLMKLPFLLIVSGDSPFKTVADLTAHLKKEGDKASYGSAANTGLVASELYKAQFGLRAVEVKYKDPLGMLNDLWAGNIAFTHLDPTTTRAHLKTGKLRALATSAKEQFKSLPGIPSAAEAGIENSDLIAWWSVAVPKGTPDAIKNRLESVFNDAVLSKEHAAFTAQIGAEPFPGNQASTKALLLKDIAAWQGYVKLAKIEVL